MTAPPMHAHPILAWVFAQDCAEVQKAIAGIPPEERFRRMLKALTN